MEGQISLFDSEEKADLFSNVQKLIDKIIITHNLPEDSIHLYSNVSSKGEKAGTVSSKSICIYEPAYPDGAYGSGEPGRNFTILNIKKASPKIELKIRDRQYDMVDLPDSASEKVLKSSPGFHFVTFEVDDNTVYNYIENNILFCLANYESSNSFGCCNLFNECSDAKECVHENKMYAMGCKYRANLEAGRIFYGKNKNI